MLEESLRIRCIFNGSKIYFYSQATFIPLLLENARPICDRSFAFKAEWRPITNGEFLAFYLSQSGKIPMPPSWVQDADTNEIKVRTLYGPVEMEYAKHWPCLTAYDDLLAYAQSKGGRLPTEPELRLFLDKYQVNYAEGANVGFRNWHPLP